MSRRWLPPALWAVFILILTSLPGDAVPDVGTVPAGTDKLVHVVLYGVLGWLSVRAVPARSRRPATIVLLLTAIGVFAALDEWHQTFVPGRYANVADWLADMIGAVIGVGVGALRGRREQTT